MNILIGSLDTLDERHARGLFRLRHRVFKERLGWKVASVGDEERDVFDDARAAYVVGCDADGAVAGCLRLLPTVRPYLLESAFPFLLAGAPPRAPAVWELSRFAVENTGSAPGPCGFSARALGLVCGAVAFARARGIDRFVLATSVAVERMMSRQGLQCRRLGRARRIGSVESVALVMEIDAVTLRALELDAGAPVPARVPLTRPPPAPAHALCLSPRRPPAPNGSPRCAAGAGGHLAGRPAFGRAVNAGART